MSEALNSPEAKLRRFRSYPKYKASGVEWLGEIPAHWDVYPLRRRLFREIGSIKIGPFGSQLKLEFMVHEGFKVYGQEHVIAHDFGRGNKYVDEAKFQELAACEIRPSDLVVTMMGSSGRCAVVPEGIERGIMDSHLLRVRLADWDLDPKYLCLLINDSSYVRDQIETEGKGAIMHGLNSSIIKSILLAVPRLIEQQMILAFLDRETAKIDALIEKNERLIELLQEKRMALITHAVTKGLDPTIPMKDSGVEWLGEIPAHWKVYPFKYLFSTIYRYPTYFGIEYANDGVKEIRGEALGADGHIIVLENQRFIPKELNDKYNRTILEEGDLVMSVRGTMGKIAYVDCRFAGANITANLLRLSPRRDLVDGQYLVKVISSKYFDRQLDRQAPQTTIKTITMPQLAVIPIAIPPKAEQLFTASFLDRETAKIDTLVAKIQEAIASLREYRTALISAVVTGKIDVREA